MSIIFGRRMLVALFVTLVILSFIPSAILGAADFNQVGSILGFKGETQEGSTVFKFPRSDIKVTVDGEPVPTAFGFGGWTAWTAMGNDVMVMGDLVLLQEEVNPVISALAEANINVSAIHNHFLGEDPRIMYMHIDGVGNPTALARGLANALGKTGLPKSQAQKQATPEQPLALDTARVENIIGQKGQAGGGVFRITIGRPGVTMRGIKVTSTMGLNTWVAFMGTDERAHVAGDVAMTAKEVNPVIRALRKGGINVLAVHNHMLDEQPRIFFLHYWGSGPAQDLAKTLREAFDQARGPVK